MALQANNRNGTRMLLRNDRNMPAWVVEQSGRIGPKPPPPPLTPENGHVSATQPQLPPKVKSQPEPDYEVIEFSNQQYSNAPLRPNSAMSGSKSPDSKLKCTLCGSNMPWVTCEECAQQIFCASCDDMYHKHPKRKNHQRKTLEKTIPPLPPKIVPGQPGPAAPVAPPRRSKRGMMTPLMQRKDQVNGNMGTFAVPPSPTPSMRNSSWHDGTDTLKRSLSMFNRPLPETPKTSNTPSESSRCGTPKSLFDNIQKPPSVVLEKIKNKANATLDRMQLLQQRYRQQKDQMERDRSGSALDQNIRAFDQWSSISPSPSHFRSGSMSSGINSSHLDLTDDSSFNLFHQQQMARQHHQMAAQRANQLGQRGMSSSVFNLNQMHRKPPVISNGWMNNSMQQAQSVAQLNCVNCSHPPQHTWGGQQQQHVHMRQHDPWSNQLNSQQHLNRSNLSLNIGPGYMMQHPHNGMYPPPVFMNQHPVVGQMYPQPYMGGMPAMNPGLAGVPPSASRAVSRAGSRMASPAMSRKSVTLRRKQRTSYREDEGTDDEDSDDDDRRSIVSNRSGVSRTRQRRISSASQFQVEEDLDAAGAKLQRARVRSQRRDSTAKSVHNDWAPGRKGSAGNNRSVDSGFNSPLKPSRIYSDLDSEGSGTRALVQAKIEQKLKEENIKQQKQTKSKRRSESPPKQKQSAAVQTPVVQAKNDKEKENPTRANESEEEYEIVEEEVTDSVSEDEEEETSKEPEPQPATQTANGPASEQLDVPAEDGDAVSLGPPPSTPDQEWECEFCTFVNEPNIKICTICCKTPSKPPKLVAKSASPPKQVKTSETLKDQTGTLKTTARIETDTQTLVDKTQSSISSSALKENSPLSTYDISISDTITVTTSTTTTSPSPQKPPASFNKKESVDDIWATLDEDIQATAHEVTRKAESSKKPTKVSTGCGTSSKSASLERQDVELQKSQAREIGTSPPPQIISAQTYDTPSIKKSEAKEGLPQLPSVNPSQPLANDKMQPSNFSMSNNIHDLKSFESEVLNNIHNISHVPSQYQHNHQQNFYPPHERNHRYRSINDLRMDDTMSVDYDSFNGMGRRHPSISELLLLQRTSSQMHSPVAGSSYDLSYRHNGMDNYKESDLYKHTTEELNAALKYCGPDMHPLVWLRDNWPKLIQTVQSLATKYGQERAENTIGTISQMEAREALRTHTGNIWQAVSECIEQRQRKYREISSKGNFSREDVVTALTTHQGNVDLALMDLGRTQLKPFLMRIWGSPGGVENESGAMVIPPSSQSSLTTPYTMDKDIHNFLSANASDCMQIPIATGAFTPTNQMPSPFDLPASLVHPYDINNAMPDNTSSYSADSKDYDPSPLPVDDSILNNKSMLKDLESLIGTMEQNQQKQNEQVLRSIQDMISNMKQDKPDDEYDSEMMRILTKSPITSPKLKNPSNDKSSKNEADVKSFVWQHIQEIVPNLVQQVEMELREDQVEVKPINTQETDTLVQPAAELPKELPPPPPPIDQDEFLMEEVIKPNLKNASIREELPPQYVYAAEIATFQMAFDKGLARQHRLEFDFDCLEEASKQVFKMYKAPNATKSAIPSEKVIKSQTILENIPTTVCAISVRTPEPPKHSPSPVIPLTIDDVLSPNAIDQHMQIDQTPIPPELPLFEDPTSDDSKTQNILSVSDDLQVPFAHSNLPDSESILDSVPSENISEETPASQSAAAVPDTMNPQAAAMGPSKSGVALEPETLTLDEVAKPSQSQEPDKISNLESTIENFEMPHNFAENGMHAEANDTTIILAGDPGLVQTQSDESTTMGTEYLPQTTQDDPAVPELTDHKSALADRQTPDPVNQADVVSDRTPEPLNQAEVVSDRTPEPLNQAEVVSDGTPDPLNQAEVVSDRTPDPVNQAEVVSDRTPNPVNQAEVESDRTAGPVNQAEVVSDRTPDPVNQAEVVSDQTSVIGFDSPNEIVQTLAGSTDFTSLDIVSTNSTISSDNTVQQVVGLSPGPPINSSELLPVHSYKVDITQPTVHKSLSSNQKKTSKIPVRRTASNKSLISSLKTEQNQHPAQQTPTPADNIPVNVLETFSVTDDATHRSIENDSEEEDLYSLASETFTDFDSRTDDVQSPTSTNEVFLMIHQDGSESIVDESTIIPSTSSSTVHSAISFSSGLKSPTEFVPSGDPSKQNLSELVMDTQRLIKQMREEINMDDFESSTDEDFTDDYSDEYDDDDEDEEDLEEEEDDDDDWDNENPEIGDVMDDLAEEDEIDEDQLNVANLSETLDTQEHRDEHNTSVLSNASVSSKHSLSLPSQHNVNDEVISIDISQPQIISNPNEESMIYVESENQIPELPVEMLATALAKHEQPMSFVESENSLPEMPVENVLVESPEEATSTRLSGVDIDVIKSTAIPLSLNSEIESENSLPELSVENVLLPVTEILPLQTENIVPELPSEVIVVPPAESIQSSMGNEILHTSYDPQPSPSTSINIVQIGPSTSSNTLSSAESTTKVTKTLTSTAKTSGSKKINSLEDDNKPLTSKGAKAKTISDKKSSDASKISNKKPVPTSKIPKPKETVKEQKPKEVPATKVQKPKATPAPQEEKPKESSTIKPQNDPKRKMPMRSKSFSGPPIGISSVKTISQKFLNQTKPQTNTAQTPKAPISVSRKPSITEAINKLTKPSTSTESHSTSSLFRTRTQPRLPKKKYHETCFSDDDYGSTTSEEEQEPFEIRQRKLSIPVFRAYSIVQELKEVQVEELVGKFMKEELVKTVSEAQIAATLVSMKFQQDVSLWAAKECSDLDHAIALLKQECELCSGTYALNEIVSMLKCTHSCCKQCAKAYFTVQITERSINDCNCPFCKQPELTNPNEHEDENLEYFSNMDIYLKNIVDSEVHELFQRKLRDRTLLKDPNFKWCVQCSSGFFARPKQKRLICPDCGSVTCTLCRKTWQKQHEGISCEKFLEWEMGNDPEIQALGVQQHLEQNGIDCPKCKFKYSLARGGCMHFTCTQCKYEFCYGCSRPFMMGAKCTISPYCAKLGLHAHHPRNCLFYLRDKLPVQLQILLKNNAVAFEVDPIESANDDVPGTSQKQTLRCPIPIQKETPTGLVDTKCNADVPDKHAGMCRTHYVEYLTAKVAKANIDPLPIFDLTDCVQELRRRGIPLPERGPWDTDEIYKVMCSEVIQKHIPLGVN